MLWEPVLPITWPREDKSPQNPHAAMLVLLGGEPRPEEAPLLLLFLETVGLFPVGSLVLLNTGEIGVIKRVGAPPNFESPLVKILIDSDGTALDGMAMDLSRDTARHVVWPMSARRAELNPVASFREDVPRG